MASTKDDESLEKLLSSGRDSLRKVFPKEAKARKCLGIAIGGLLLILVFIGIWAHKQPPKLDGPLIKLPPANLDAQYVPQRTFDIVISHYSEPLPQLRLTLDAISALPVIASQKPNIILYTKHALTPLSHIASELQLPEANVRRLPNLGREGGTYLSHLLDNWDNLAAHTLFMQAEVHNEYYLLQRIQDYFTNETGYLPLGFSGKFCELVDCEDEWGWKDRYSQLPSIYTLLYNSLPPPGKFSLSYKGQFVVSARRARGVAKEKLKVLMETLEGNESPYAKNTIVDTAEMTPRKEGDSTAPKFGFVLERAWGMIFGCADGEMARTCPNLWRHRNDGESLEDCQCLDKATTTA